ncbi:DUF2470 domain-containing protein [Nostoc sp. FACHB-110]|uniref:DUF2470 domain-containing protein n=1 Tax=Nostoc sp. FACHB-110 TaxID=2692834 RepID=UPI001688BAA3|nr:DUF2470 domain-containing protein [Nostoc sp. FACHB-110]MBD2435304.1 DUF2470 domain-containing protein [Nostoc sp. FACHB-110]
MSDQLSAKISDRICNHMNEDHADAVLLYARVFAEIKDVASAKMLSIDAEGMNLSAEVNGESQPVRVVFDHILKDSEDAHQTLIAMVRQARTKAQ